MVRVRVRVRGLPGTSVLDANDHVGSLEVKDQLGKVHNQPDGKKKLV